MKRKTIAVVIVIALLVAALGYVTKYALEDKGLRESKKRIRIYRIADEELKLKLSILESQIKLANIQQALAPPAKADPNNP